jgi:S-adenosylmethionine:tRNA ribosyltransferase-isomerase
MELKDFDYHLPERCIARYPLAKRTDSRLLYVHVKSGHISHHLFSEFPDFLQANDLLVLNNTKVLPARLYGHKDTGGKVEVLMERMLSDHQMLAQVRSSKSLKQGQAIEIEGGGRLLVEGRQGVFYQLHCQEGGPLLALLQRAGHMPLPPYLQRDDEALDQERYQSVFASKPGAVAAPTASLHFDEALLAQCQRLGVQRTEVTLHVGSGTFAPVRVNDLSKHDMHAEYMQLSDVVCAKVKQAKTKQARVVAVGTTAVRCLESAAKTTGSIQPFSGETSLFLTPGDPFHCTDILLTNFHLPKSTLLMLVSAFSGHGLTMCAYREAVASDYRFYSYGDAMLIDRSDHMPLFGS